MLEKHLTLNTVAPPLGEGWGGGLRNQVAAVKKGLFLLTFPK
jgi:hypothetical protein